MASDSDTESEPESSQYQAFSSNWDVSPDGNDMGQPTPENAKAAIDALRDMALCDFRRDQDLHDKILCASNAILAFLKHGVCGTDSEITLGGSSARLSAFSDLVQMPFMSMLFDYRKVFHSIAAEALLPGTTTSTVVCWVDVVLAALGNAVVEVAHGHDGPRDSGSEIARKHAEENTLRAAAQLPYTWHAVPNVISSERASPAAKRLALRLVFAVYIMGPQLNSRDGWLDDGILASEMFQIVQCRFAQNPGDPVLGSPCMLDGVQQQERINDAMMISLYAASDATLQQSQTMSPFRPYSINSLLSVIQVIMNLRDTGSSIHLASPCEVLDPAQTILLGWGGVLPWFWRTWKDRRAANDGCITHMTATWLFHLDRTSSCDWTECLAPELTKNPSAVSSAIIQLLHHGVIALCSNQVHGSYPPPLVDVLSKACWASARLLDRTSVGGWWDDSHAIDLCKCLCILFVVFGNSSNELQAKYHVIEALTFVTVDQFQEAFKSIQDDSNARFTFRLDETVTRTRRLLFMNNGEFSTESENLLAAKSFLDFLTILARKGGRERFVGQTCSAFLGSIVGRLSRDSPTSLPSVILCDAVLTTVATLESTMSDHSPADLINRVWKDETIWQIAMAQRHPGLPVASAFSQYIVAASRVCDSLRCAEAWDCLRDVLLLTLSRSFVADDEPLSLLVCPSICRALLRLLQLMDGHALEFVLSSPWTMALCTDLQAVLEQEGKDEYTGILQARLETVGRALVHQITRPDDRDERGPNVLGSDLLFCALHPYPKLILL